MGRRPRRKLTDKELILLEGYSAIRVPMEQIATLLNISKDELERMEKRYDAVREAISMGRSKATTNVRQTLYSMALGSPGRSTPPRRDPKTGELIEGEFIPARPPDFQALKFWCQTQEGFKIKDTLELTGANGAPLGTDVPDEELEKRTARAIARIAARKNVAVKKD